MATTDLYFTTKQTCGQSACKGQLATRLSFTNYAAHNVRIIRKTNTHTKLIGTISASFPTYDFFSLCFWTHRKIHCSPNDYLTPNDYLNYLLNYLLHYYCTVLNSKVSINYWYICNACLHCNVLDPFTYTYL
jgi:hypothetical protein